VSARRWSTGKTAIAPACLSGIGRLKVELRALLERAARKSTKTKRHRLFANNLLKRWPALWTFAVGDGVEPTNNHAVRSLRRAVIYRRLSLGSQSDQGERTIERPLSAPPSPAAYKAARSLPTSPTSSAPASDAIRLRSSPDPAGV
jgi:hypothetical protein